MQNDQILRAYLRETTPAVMIIIGIACIAAVVSVSMHAPWLLTACLSGFAATIAGMYAHFVRRIRNGTFGRDPRERQALDRWMARHKAIRYPGMNLPG